MSEIKINIPAIGFAFDKVMRETWAVLNVFYAGLEKLSQDELKELVNKPLGDGDFKFSFTKIDADPIKVSDLAGSWLLERGLEQIVRGMNESLCLADEILNCLKLHGKNLDVEQSVSDVLERIRNESCQKHLPQLVSHIETSLNFKFPLSKSVKSINGVRRIYVHRGKKVDRAQFEFEYTTHRFFIDDGEKEHRLSDVLGVTLPRGGQVKLRKEIVSKNYTKGDTVSISMREFTDIAMTCFEFIQTVSMKVNEFVTAKLESTPRN